ncbi:MAG: family 43 glycosylhydrolase [Clostridia bacterium]|nr:family 43 glycosylhydrolase [Clostridia bacterium]
MNFDTPLTNADINIRDPFILTENGIYYMYGTSGKNFGVQSGCFNVWIGTDLLHWSAPIKVFDADAYSMNDGVNWAPEVHKYNGKYYMCATFTLPGTDRRGTHILIADSPAGEFVPHSAGSITPQAWWALDGTLYFENNVPYMVFCHEHVQIGNGTVEYVRLSDDLKHAVGMPVTLFRGSDAYGTEDSRGERYVTDGPFLYRHTDGTLSMIWSTIQGGNYVQCRAVSTDGTLGGTWTQSPHLFSENGGHGMLFRDLNGTLILTLHSPNRSGEERPVFIPMAERGRELHCYNL